MSDKGVTILSIVYEEGPTCESIKTHGGHSRPTNSHSAATLTFSDNKVIRVCESCLASLLARYKVTEPQTT